MKNPQKLAKELMKIKTIEIQSKNACCAYVFLWCLGIEPDDIEAIKLVDEAIVKGTTQYNTCIHATVEKDNVFATATDECRGFTVCV